MCTYTYIHIPIPYLYPVYITVSKYNSASLAISTSRPQRKIAHACYTLLRHGCCYEGAYIRPVRGPPLHHAPRNLRTQRGKPGVLTLLDP